MPLQNRVTPLGEMLAIPARGLVFGNRGCLHDAAGNIRKRYAVRRWIACVLEFRGRRHPPMHPGWYTGLFFLDEATAFAAGHRPCAECRRPDYNAFIAAWRGLHPDQRSADSMDMQLHLERLQPDGRTQRHHEAPMGDLPDGAFVLVDGRPHAVVGSRLRLWTPDGYSTAIARAELDRATVITPPSLVAVLRSGWGDALVPFLHPSAHAA